jgi:predicted ferric reductase
MKRRYGNLLPIVLVALNLIVWIVFPPVNDGRTGFYRVYAGEVLGSTAIILMSVSLFISTRPKWAEKFFGGLDKMYILHRRAAVAALLVLLVHVLTVPISWGEFGLGNYLAIIAFTAIGSTVVVSISPQILPDRWLDWLSWENWRFLHRFNGIFFTLGFIHSITITTSLDALVAITWVQLFFIIGLVSYLYTEIFGRYFGKYLHYTVEAVRHPSGQTTEVTLAPVGKAIGPRRAGQFLFVRFPKSKGLDEVHPFTISSGEQEPVLRLTIKVSGDFTRRLFEGLEPGAAAVVEGPFGGFVQEVGGPRQVWVAGGIGITPFLSFVRSMGAGFERRAMLVHAVSRREEALFVEEFQQAAAANPGFNFVLRVTSEQGSLTVADVLAAVGERPEECSYFLCGPFGMIEAFQQGLMAAGVPAAQIHFEEFRLR